MAPQQWLANQDSTSEQKYDLRQVPPGGSTKRKKQRLEASELQQKWLETYIPITTDP